MLVDELDGLSVRARNALRRAGVVSLDDLCRMSDDDLMDLPCFGVTCLGQVHAALVEPRQRPLPPLKVKHPSRLPEPDLGPVSDLALQRCPYAGDSTYSCGFRDAWLKSYRRFFLSNEISEEEVMTTREIRDACLSENADLRSFMGHAKIRLGEPPNPVGAIWRLHLYSKSDAMEWISPRLAGIERQHQRRERKKQASLRYRTRMTPIRSKIGFRGVHKQVLSDAYTAELRFDGKMVYLGSYELAEDAALAVDKSRVEHGLPPVNLPERAADLPGFRFATRQRSVGGGQWLLDTLEAQGPLGARELWLLNKSAPGMCRFSSLGSLYVALRHQTRKGVLRKQLDAYPAVWSIAA